MRAVSAVVGAAMVLIACERPPEAVGPLADAVYSAASPSESITLGAPLFGMDSEPDGSLLVAIASSGVVSVRSNYQRLVQPLPGVNGVESIGSGAAWVVTGGSQDPSQIFPTSRKVFRISHGNAREIADLWAFEQAINPDKIWNDDPLVLESNPFDVAALTGGRVLVADAAANAILEVGPGKNVDWVAVLTPTSAGGPEPVPTSIAIGPDGAYYTGELTGFPGTPGLSRIWRIAPGSRHVVCPSSACTIVASGFTSIIDLEFAPNGTLYVVELDEAGWFGMELNGFAKTPAGGTVSTCNVTTGVCTVRETGLSLPTAVAVDRKGTAWVAEHFPMLFASAQVRPLQ